MIGALPDGRLPAGRMLGLAAALVLGMLLGAKPPVPSPADDPSQAAREAHLRGVAADAAAACSELLRQLHSARDAARRGAALIVEGDTPPQRALSLAADHLEQAEPLAVRAGAATRRLRGTLQSVRPGGEPTVADLPTAGELAGIATQLRAAGDAAAAFLERRHAAEETLAQLGRALDALDRGDLDAASAALASASAARQVLVDWEEPPTTLGLWLQTTDAMITAAADMVEARRTGDAAAAQRAVDAYAAAAQDAHRADVSLGLSLSETGAGLTGTPLRRLADALAAVEEARAQADALQQ
jgi:hypothetical protein